tara:strand:+ start:810 stop:923 length:114 start_codon:yes stop_codon:yes gene_type:complete
MIAAIAIETGINPTDIANLDMEMFDALVRVIDKKYKN